jgi:SpoVK/Ycf46/Vps4 family AAA+-type ATPase
MNSLWTDGSKVDEYILGKLGIFDKLEKSKSIMLSANKENENKIVKVSALEKINALTGLEPIKSYARNLIALNEIDKKRKVQGLPVVSVNRHLVLLGNPGTGKTTSARLLGELFKELGILSKGHFVEVGQQDLIAEYVGQTAKKTNDAIQKAEKQAETKK